MKKIENQDQSTLENIREVLCYAVVIILTASLILIAISYTTKVNIKNYNKIVTGMNVSEVIDILGKHYKYAESTNFAGYKCDVYIWQDLRETKHIAVSFVNGRVVAKAQSGLY